MKFNLDKLPAGAIIHKTQLHKGRRDRRWWRSMSGLIQYWLGDGCHDAIVINACGVKWIGDMVSPVGKLTRLQHYEDLYNAGKIDIDVLWPKGATIEQGLAASHWWLTHEKGMPYNWPAFFLLPFKVLSDELEWPWDLELDWCTESVMWAWKNGANLDPYHNRKPTTYTTEKRRAEGNLESIRDQVCEW